MVALLLKLLTLKPKSVLIPLWFYFILKNKKQTRKLELVRGPRTTWNLTDGLCPWQRNQISSLQPKLSQDYYLFLRSWCPSNPPALQYHWPEAHTDHCCICRTPPSLQTPTASSHRTRSRRQHSREEYRLALQGWTTGWWLQKGESQTDVQKNNSFNHTFHFTGSSQPHSSVLQPAD